MRFFILLICLLSLFTCTECGKKHHKKHTEQVWQPVATTVKVKRLQMKVIRQFPHKGDRNYTQGFEIYNGILYESTGLQGQSCLKKIDLKTGNIILQKNIDDYFAEGLTILNGYITLLSWKNMKTFSYDMRDFSEKNISFSYNTEGWGLTDNDSQFIMTDGSDKIYFRNAMTFAVEKELSVNYEGNPVSYLNELEFVNGKIYANVYGTSMIYVIDPSNGDIIEEADCSQLVCAKISETNPENVLNGIAWNEQTKTFLITGKRCILIYEVVFENTSH